MKKKTELPPSDIELNEIVKVPSFNKEYYKQEEDKRWSLQEEIAKSFDDPLKHGLFIWDDVTCSISPCSRVYADYTCNTIMNAWPDIMKNRLFRGPTHAALDVRSLLVDYAQDMIESSNCFVSDPGALHFTLSREWIARSIHKMIKDGIESWAPKLSVKKAIIYFSSQNIAKKFSMGHLRSIIVGESLARMLEYSRVEVIRRFHEGDDLDFKSIMMMTEFLIERFPIGEVDDQAIGEPEVLYEKSKKRFEKDAEFRERALQVWDERHQLAWMQICKISLERYQNVYHRLGFQVKEGKSLYAPYTLDLSMVKDLSMDGEGVVIEGRTLSLVDTAATWHGLDMIKADWILHVTAVGKEDYIQACINAAEGPGCIITDPCQHTRIIRVGYGPVEGDAEERSVDDLLDEAKRRCKVELVGLGAAAKSLENTAEALGYGAVRYADLKNNRLAVYKFSFEQMLNEKGNTAVYLQYTHVRVCSFTKTYRNKIKKLKNLKVRDVENLKLNNEKEREMGLHLLRFSEILSEVQKDSMPHKLCDYLYELCKKFNNLYPFVGRKVCCGEKTGEETSKVLLCEATRVMVIFQNRGFCSLNFDAKVEWGWILLNIIAI